jgi:hypothetical protein
VLKNGERCLPLGGGDVLGDLGAVSTVVHEEELEVSFATDEHLSESAREEMAGDMVLLASDNGHADGTLELSAGSTINTSRFSPGDLKLHAFC